MTLIQQVDELKGQVERIERELRLIRVEMDGEHPVKVVDLKARADRHSAAEEIANKRRYEIAMDGMGNGDQAAALGRFLKAGGWIPPEQYR
jgi:hypothetical protein